MNSFIKLSAEERNAYFAKASEITGLPIHIIEKDFWVCWTLNKLFSLDGVKDHLTFKGGTSLSKVYNLIKRFSEDIDVSVEKSYLGFVGDRDPKNKSISNKKRETLIKELSEECRKFVNDDLASLLKKKFSRELTGLWSLESDPEDKDGQTLLFRYPTTIPTTQYVSPFVKIEMGARADHWPVIKSSVKSYLEEAIPSALKNPEMAIQILDAKRTFWEKATILHMHANTPEDKKIPIRQSRHYYDFFCMLNSDVKDDALKDIALLEVVADHKELYYRAAWAKYYLAKKGTLKLMPSEINLKQMEKDYSQMEVMFFEKPPAWNDIVDTIRRFEKSFNS